MFLQCPKHTWTSLLPEFLNKLILHMVVTKYVTHAYHNHNYTISSLIHMLNYSLLHTHFTNYKEINAATTQIFFMRHGKYFTKLVCLTLKPTLSPLTGPKNECTLIAWSRNLALYTCLCINGYNMKTKTPTIKL